MPIRFTARAESDLDGIYDFTAERWGVHKAEEYVAQIRAKCRHLAAGRLSGRSINHIRTGYCRVTAGSHTIFFRRLDEGVEIIRILHGCQDVTRHLS